MDLSNIIISRPVLKERANTPKHFIQYLHQNNQALQFQSDVFSSNGPTPSMSGGYEMRITLSPEVRQSLRQLEDYASKNVEIPEPFKSKWIAHSQISGDEVPLKPLYDGNVMYVKLAHDVELYNMNHIENGSYQPFAGQPPALGKGSYTVLVRINGIYIGSHNTNPKVASLQMRIVQISYAPKLIGQCLIRPPTSSMVSDTPSNEMTVDVEDDVLERILANENDSASASTASASVTSKRKNVKRTKKPKNDTISEVINSVVN